MNDESVVRWILFILTVILLVAFFNGCTKHGATSEVIHVATEKCAPNDGLRQIDDATYQNETESCGYKCSRDTGRIRYDADFACNNGAHFSLRWSKFPSEEEKKWLLK